jgi:hypothetical protein
MAYDEELAGRIRALIGDEPAVTEQRMFGGLAFLIGGNMAIASTARPMEMRGREMRGWLRVEADDVGTDAELSKWVDVGSAYARSLPVKD